jgi:hypothetical protein
MLHYNVFIDAEYTRLTVEALRLPADELRLLIAERERERKDRE